MQADAALKSDDFFIPSHVAPELVQPFDIFADSGIAKCPFTRTSQLRDHGRVFWNPINTVFRGSWVITHADDLRYVMSNPKIFSSKGQAGFMLLEGKELELVPLEADPPRHTAFRKLLNPLLSPPTVAKMTEGVTSRAVELIETVRSNGHCEFMADFAIPFPVSIFMQLMGLPADQMARFLKWEEDLTRSFDSSKIQAAALAVTTYLQDLAAERRVTPTNDLTSYVVQAEMDGRKLTDREVMSVLYLLFLAGLDTVTAATGWIFHHIATHPEQQQQLRENPALIPKAIEEMMRRYSIVTSHRRVTEDTEVAGVKMLKGDWVSIINTLGSLDPDEFSDPMDADLNRRNVRHFGFGFGPHFCMGAHLARRELEVAIREWLARVSNLRVRAETEPVGHGGHVFGHDRLELEWDVA